MSELKSDPRATKADSAAVKGSADPASQPSSASEAKTKTDTLPGFAGQKQAVVRKINQSRKKREALKAKRKCVPKQSLSKKFVKNVIGTTNRRYIIDGGKPVENEIFMLSNLVAFLHKKIKINGKTGKVKKHIQTTTENNKIIMVTKVQFSKRYFKYLIKKFLKKFFLRDWLKLVASSRNAYEIRYFNIRDVEELEE